MSMTELSSADCHRELLMWDVAFWFKSVQLKLFWAQCTFVFCLHFVQASSVTVVQVVSLTVLQLLCLGDDVFTEQHINSRQWKSWEAEVEWYLPTYFLDSQIRYMRISSVILYVLIPVWNPCLNLHLSNHSYGKCFNFKKMYQEQHKE